MNVFGAVNAVLAVLVVWPAVQLVLPATSKLAIARLGRRASVGTCCSLHTFRLPSLSDADLVACRRAASRADRLVLSGR